MAESPFDNDNISASVPRDIDRFPFGHHFNKMFKDVPVEYLYSIRRYKWIDSWPHVKAYIDFHMEKIEDKLRARGLID